MNQVVGNIWDYLDTHYITISTNQGWTSAGHNVMGAGIAKEAKTRYPILAEWYGEFCRTFPGLEIVTSYRFLDSKTNADRRFIMFPTKPLNREHPNMSWRQPSSLKLIEACAIDLAKFGEYMKVPIVLPMVGCKNGGLSPGVVIPILNKYLTGDNFTLVIEPIQELPY